MAGQDEIGTLPIRLDERLWLYQCLPDTAAAREAALRRHLATLLGCSEGALAFRREPGGRPRLATPTPELSFSVSHRGGLLLIATAWNEPVGVDIELMDGQAGSEALDDAVARDFFTAGEMRWLERLATTARHDGFLVLWTAKEAVLKAWGEGLAQGLAEPDLAPALAIGRSLPPSSVSVAAGGMAWRVSWFSTATVSGRALAALAKRESMPR